MCYNVLSSLEFRINTRSTAQMEGICEIILLRFPSTRPPNKSNDCVATACQMNYYVPVKPVSPGCPATPTPPGAPEKPVAPVDPTAPCTPAVPGDP